MSKLKIGFSALLVLILMSLFSSFAMAEEKFDPTNSTHPTEDIYVGDVDNNGQTNTHKTHGNFQNNTNTCANCHSTHNGVDAMLLRSGEYDLCLACHDGTMGFYNVKAASEAGIIGSHEMSASMHDVGSDLAIGKAPGALVNQEKGTFECSSCHNPHGSANDRLLNEVVAGKSYAQTYDVHIEGYHETITKKGVIDKGTKGIKLDLSDDNSTPELQAINSSTTLSGLKITKSNGIYNKLDDGLTQEEVYNYKLNYSEFCSACHDDYLKNRESETRDTPTESGGHYYTHTTSSTKSGRSCTACHYAHGTDITLLKDTSGRTIAELQKPTTEGGKGFTLNQAKAYMKDVTPINEDGTGGSALKRYTNMAVCWACHQSTHAIANTPGTSTYPASGKIPGGDYSGKAGIK